MNKEKFNEFNELLKEYDLIKPDTQESEVFFEKLYTFCQNLYPNKITIEEELKKRRSINE